MTDSKGRRLGAVKIVALGALLVLVLILAVPWLIRADRFRPVLASELSNALGREVRLGHLSLSLLSGALAAGDISISDDPAFSKTPFVQAKSLRIGVAMRPLIFARKLQIKGIYLDKPEITLIRSAAGDWNFSRIGPKSGGSQGAASGGKADVSAAGSIAVDELRITGGRVTLFRGSENRKPFVYDKVDLSARNLSFASVSPFSFATALPGGGSAKIDGRAGPIHTADASLTPFSATIAVEGLDLVASGIAGPDSGLSARIDFQGSVDSDSRQMHSKGNAGVDRLRLVKSGSPAGMPVSITYRIRHDLRSQSGVIAEGQVGCGRAAARLSGSYDVRGDDLLMVLKVRGEGMPVQDLESLLPALDLTLPDGASLQGGALTADLVAQGSLDTLVISGTAGVRDVRLIGFDLGTRLATVATLAGLQPRETTGIEEFTMDLRIAPAGIQISRLVLTVPALGELTGYGEIGSGHSLDFRMLARLKSSGTILNGLTGIAGVRIGETINVPFLIGGTTADPKFRPDVKGIAGNILEGMFPGKAAKAEKKGP